MLSFTGVPITSLVNALPGRYYLICSYQVDQSLAKYGDHISVPAGKLNLAVPGGPGSLDYWLLGRIPVLHSWLLHVLLMVPGEPFHC